MYNRLSGIFYENENFNLQSVLSPLPLGGGYKTEKFIRLVILDYV